jgi:hypothetical protein
VILLHIKMATNEEDEQVWDRWEEILWAIYPKIPAALSIVGSVCIIYELLVPRVQRLKLGSVERTIVAMSVYDIFSSFAFFLSTWYVQFKKMLSLSLFFVACFLSYLII